MIFLAVSSIFGTAGAVDYPLRPVRLIVPFPAGGTNDVVGRVLGNRLAEILRQPVVVENRPGAAGAVGTAELARSTPDGYTIGLASLSTMASAPACNPKAGYDPIASFRPIMQVATVPNMVAAGSASPIRTFEQMVDEAKRRPEQVGFATAGVCSMQHLLGEQLQASTGTKLTHVPYRGSAAAISDVIAGRVAVMIDNRPALASFIDSGQMRLLAIGWPERLPSLPAVPTLAELGMPEINSPSWYGLIAPATVPAHVIAILSEATRTALRDPEVVERLRIAGAEPAASTSEEFAQTIAGEISTARERVARYGIQP